MRTIAILTGRARYDLECQIVVHTDAQAKREIKELKQMGLTDARAREFPSEAAMDEWLEKYR